jgi:hypothetical protein
VFVAPAGVEKRDGGCLKRIFLIRDKELDGLQTIQWKQQAVLQTAC